EIDVGDVTVVIVPDAGRQALHFHAGNVGPHRRRQLFEVGIEVLEYLPNKPGADASLAQDNVPVDSFAVGRRLKVKARKQPFPDRLCEAPAAPGRAAAMLPAGIKVDIDEDFRGVNPVVGPEVVGLQASKMIEELVIPQGGTVALLVV